MKRAACLILAGAQVAAVAGAWLWFHTHHPLGNLLAGDPAGRFLAWGRLAGLLAALGVLLQLGLMARVRAVEQAFGLDRLSRFHHVFGFALVALLVLHPVLVTVGHAAQAEVGCAEQAADFWTNWRGLATAMAGTALMLAALAASVAALRKRLRYEVWHATHLTLYAAFALTFFHQVVSGSDLTENPAFRIYWCLLYACVLLGLLAYRVVRPCLLYFRHRFAVEQVARETGDVHSVMIGGRGLSLFRADAGQFVIVRFLAKGFRWEAHPFSLSRVPDGRSLRLSVKGLGDFTRRLPALEPGTPVLVDGPYGVLTAHACASGKALLIAGGIGITPLRALAEEFASVGRDTVLVYGNRSAAGIVFKDELDALAAASGGRLRVTYVLSDAAPGWGGERGYVDRERLVRLVPDLGDRDVYLCGPRAMMEGVRRALRELGVAPARLHDERFSL
jgi:predicted ferric reductase